MAFQSGHTGLVTGTTFSAGVRAWALNDSALLLDTSVLGNNTRRRTPGIADWRFSFEIFIDDAAFDSDVANITPGTSVAIVAKLNATDEYTGTGLIESHDLRCDVGDAIRGTLVVLANSDLVRTFA